MCSLTVSMLEAEVMRNPAAALPNRQQHVVGNPCWRPSNGNVTNTRVHWRQSHSLMISSWTLRPQQAVKKNDDTVIRATPKRPGAVPASNNGMPVWYRCRSTAEGSPCGMPLVAQSIESLAERMSDEFRQPARACQWSSCYDPTLCVSGAMAASKLENCDVRKWHHKVWQRRAAPRR